MVIPASYRCFLTRPRSKTCAELPGSQRSAATRYTRAISAFANRNWVDGFDLYSGVDEGESGAAEGFVLAEHKRQITADGSLGHGNSDQHIGLDVLLHIRPGNE